MDMVMTGDKIIAFHLTVAEADLRNAFASGL